MAFTHTKKGEIRSFIKVRIRIRIRSQTSGSDQQKTGSDWIWIRIHNTSTNFAKLCKKTKCCGSTKLCKNIVSNLPVANNNFPFKCQHQTSNAAGCTNKEGIFWPGTIYCISSNRLYQCCGAGAARSRIFWSEPEPYRDSAPAPTVVFIMVMNLK
jgi:hypothetical protein